MLLDNKIDYSAAGIKSAHDFLLKYTGKGGDVSQRPVGKISVG